jgi:hypothetical protein
MSQSTTLFKPYFVQMPTTQTVCFATPPYALLDGWNALGLGATIIGMID